MGAWERIEELAKELAEHEGIDNEAALLRTIEDHPELYEAFSRELRGPVGR